MKLRDAAIVSLTVTVIAVAMEVGCWESVMAARSAEMNVRSLAVLNPRGSARRYRRYSGFQWCCHLRSSRRWQYRSALLRAGHLLTPAGSGGACTSGSSEHTEYKETSCRTWSSFLRSCCRRLVCGQRTWVLSLGVGDLLRCSGCGRGRCNVSVVDR